MNERLKQLADLATTIEVLDGRGFDETQYTERFYKEAFAQLIVLECIKILETNKRCDIYTGELTDCDWNDVIHHQIDSLKEHFGIR